VIGMGHVDAANIDEMLAHQFLEHFLAVS